MNRRASRVDGNHTEIVGALLSAGCSVQSLAQVGCGCPDLLVGRGDRNYLLEIKDPSQPPNKRELRESQKKFMKAWRGPVALVESVDDALKAVGVL